MVGVWVWGGGVLELVWWSEESCYMFEAFAEKDRVCDAIYVVVTSRRFAAGTKTGLENKTKKCASYACLRTVL